MEQLCRFHSEEYIQFLKQISPENFKGLLCGRPSVSWMKAALR